MNKYRSLALQQQPLILNCSVTLTILNLYNQANGKCDEQAEILLPELRCQDILLQK
jgi:hypothetical protein